MKKLTKVLLTVMVFVLLASTAIATVIVSGDVIYNGQLTRVNDLLAAVDSKTGDKAFDKLGALESVNTYILKTPVDPATDGYDEFVANYNAKVVETINELTAKTETFSETADKADKYVLIYASIAVLESNEAILDKESADYRSAVDAAYDNGYAIAKSYIQTAKGVKAAFDIAYANYLNDPDNSAVISELDGAYAPLRAALESLHRFTIKCSAGWLEYIGQKSDYSTVYADMIAAETAELWAMVADYNSVGKRGFETIRPNIAYNAAADKLAVAVSVSSVDLTSSANSALYEAINAVSADIEARNLAAKELLDNKANINEFEYTGATMNYTLSDNKMPWGWSNTQTENGSYAEIKTDATGNKYMALHYGSYTGSYMNMIANDTSNGYVLEYDIGTEYGGDIKYMWVYSYDADKNGAKGAMGYYGIKNGAFYMPSAKGGSIDWSTPLTDKVIVPGASTHVAIAFNADTWTVEVFVDYVSIGTTSVARVTEYVLKEFRLANGNNDLGKNQTITVDNIVGYKGSSPRSIQSLSSYSDGEKFKFYASYAVDTNKDPVYRSTAYDKAAVLYETYKNSAAYKEIADAFAAIDYESEIFYPARDGCMQNFALLLERLGSSPITTLNISNKTKEISKIDDYLNAHLSFYNQASAEFVALKTQLNDAKKQINKIQNLQAFIDALSRFKRVDTYAALSRYLETAQKYYELCGFASEDNYNAIKDDTSVVNLEKSLGMTIVEYYAGMEAKVLASRKTENSSRIIACVDLIINAEYQNGASYEATESFWKANYDYINKYVLVIRQIVSSASYDPTYEGVGDAIATYNTMDAYFYELLQREHCEVIGEQLAKYLLTDSYIEKLGICTFVNNYVEINDVDTSRDDISELLVTLSVFEGEVENHKDTYSEILEENTQYFIGITNKMLAYNDYKSLYALYVEAQVYYYGMNVDSDEAKVAIEIYNECEAKLNEMIYYADAFAGYATRLASATTRAKKYQYLVECSKYRDYLDTTMDDVSLYINYYDNALASYNAGVEISNSEILNVDGVACATRVLSVPASVLAVIKNIFS